MVSGRAAAPLAGDVAGRRGGPHRLRRRRAQAGATLTFMSTLRPGHAVAGGFVTVDVNMLLYSFGLPLFAALTLAVREPARWKPLLIGYAVLIPAIAFGVLADFLKNVAITA